MRGGDQVCDPWEDVDFSWPSISDLSTLPTFPIEDIDSYFSAEELRTLAYSDRKEITTRDLTLEMINLRKRRVFLESVLERQQRGLGNEESRVGNPRQGRYRAG